MQLTTKPIRERLVANAQRPDDDHRPVLKIFNPSGEATWLFTQCDEDDPDRIFGLCHVDNGEPELGWERLSTMERIRNRLGLALERDRHFHAHATLAVYAEAARRQRRIVEDASELDRIRMNL